MIPVTMLNDLLLHTQTRQQIEQSIQERQAHGLLLTGPQGLGKETLAHILAANLLNLPVAQLPLEHPYVKSLTSMGDTIAIDDIRELHQFTKLKTTGKEQLRRAIIIPAAERMTTEAQNALLKLLEEPPSDTVIILTTPSSRMLLPTIVSRLQMLAVQAPDERLVAEYFTKAGFAEPAVRRAMALGSGRMGLMHAILQEDSGHPLIQQLDLAKTLLGSSAFERLLFVESLSKQKSTLPLLFEALLRVAKAALNGAAARGRTADIKRLHHSLQAIYAAQEALDRNAQPKLLLSWLMLEL